MAETVEATIYSECLRSLGDQTEILKGVRQSAGVILGANSGIVALMSKFATTKTSAVTGLDFAPPVLLLIGACLAVSVLWPTSSLTTRFSAGPWLQFYPSGHGAAPEDIHRFLSEYLDKHLNENARALEGFLMRFRLAATSLLLGASLWYFLYH